MTLSAELRKAKKLVLLELIEVCRQRLIEGKMVPEVVKPLDVAGLIKS
jgi:hypothetical protein